MLALASMLGVRFLLDGRLQPSRLEPRPMAARDTFAGGKHVGRRFEDVANADRSYCEWVLRCVSLPLYLRPFAHWLKQEYGGVIPYGKHKHFFFSEIYEVDPAYCVWASELTDPSPAMEKFQTYLRQREQTTVDASSSDGEEPATSPSPPQKRARIAPTPGDNDNQHMTSWTCRVCFEKAIREAFLPCGHILCCVDCGNQVEACPLCRRHIDNAVRIYAS